VFGNVFGGVAKSMEPFQKPGLALSLILLLICTPLLIIDLGQPGRFFYPIIYFHWTSPLSWGALFLPLFGLCIIGFFVGLMQGKESLMRLTGIVGSLLALSMPLYTGLDLMVHQARELWANPTIPLLFVILSMSSGTALVAVVQLARGQINEQTAEFLHAFLYLSLAVTLALFLAEWLTLAYGTEEEQQAFAVINGEFGMLYWGVTLVIGILVPLAVGAFTFRQVIINAGQLTQLYF
jgi:formate-dependent nitrite reductase membrane component NrfD